jgi:prepilin-type N-terminal cleavage/methylation domain-containing protein/prepilin-type processing-associated H-X9-DG protein
MNKITLLKNHHGSIRLGFSMVELLVVLAISAILLAILITTLSSARERSVIAQCSSNLRQFHNAIMLYANDNNGRLPPGHHNQTRDGVAVGAHGVWWYSLWEYMGWDPQTPKTGENWRRFAKQFGCPKGRSDKETPHLNYAMSAFLTSDHYRLASLEQPARNMLMVTHWGNSRARPNEVSNPSWSPPPGPSVSWNFWYDKSANVLFLDGSARLLSHESVSAIAGDLDDSFWGLNPNGPTNLR